jgi:hypothetical protein
MPFAHAVESGNLAASWRGAFLGGGAVGFALSALDGDIGAPFVFALFARGAVMAGYRRGWMSGSRR